MKKLQTITRLALTAALIGMAYKETGPYTAAVLVLMAGAIEMIAHRIADIVRALELNGAMHDVHSERLANASERLATASERMDIANRRIDVLWLHARGGKPTLTEGEQLAAQRQLSPRVKTRPQSEHKV